MLGCSCDCSQWGLWLCWFSILVGSQTWRWSWQYRISREKKHTHKTKQKPKQQTKDLIHLIWWWRPVPSSTQIAEAVLISRRRREGKGRGRWKGKGEQGKEKKATWSLMTWAWSSGLTCGRRELKALLCPSYAHFSSCAYPNSTNKQNKCKPANT